MKPITFIDWVLQLNYSIATKVIELIRSGYVFDVVHLHDWLVAFSGIMLRDLYGIPYVCTFHATEYGRNAGIHNEVQSYINDVETKMSQSVESIIVNSSYMKQEVTRLFNAKSEDIFVIPNGVDVEKFNFYSCDMDFRRLYATDNEKIVFFVGRLVNEKGVHVLLDAVPKVLSRCYNAKFIIAGKGPELDNLKRRAQDMNISNKVLLPGYLSEEELMKFYKCVDIAVFPSLYEPFGIVALEAMVANVPVIVSDAGGLNEIINHKENGWKFRTGNSEMLAECILDIIFNNDLANNIALNAYNNIKKSYIWEGIAEKVKRAYIYAIDKKNKQHSYL